MEVVVPVHAGTSAFKSLDPRLTSFAFAKLLASEDDGYQWLSLYGSSERKRACSIAVPSMR